MIGGMTAAGPRVMITPEHARVILAIERARGLARHFEALESRLTQEIGSWLMVSPALEDLSAKEIARAWEKEHPAGQLEKRTRADVERAFKGWAAVYGSHKGQTVLRMQLLACLHHAQEWALDEVRATFDLIAPEHNRRLDERDWASAIKAWRRKQGRPPKSPRGKHTTSKWEVLAKFVNRAGFLPVSEDRLKDQWEAWKRGGRGPTLFSGLPAAHNKQHENGSKQTGRKRAAPGAKRARGPSRRRPSR
jgi:hypothetical protein